MILQNLISLLFGDDIKTIRADIVEEGIAICSARITRIQALTLLVTVVLVIGVAIFLKKAKIGLTVRAVANDPGLACAFGINIDVVILWVFGIGSALASIAGVLFALDVDMTPIMGMNLLMMGVVSMIIGGIGNNGGIALGGLLLGLTQQFGAWFTSAQWQDTIAFLILSVFLLCRPQGLFGKKITKASV
ncbi:MAG: ABC transporter permease subunit [Gammaproteobacteria bacterium]